MYGGAGAGGAADEQAADAHLLRDPVYDIIYHIYI